MRCQKRQVTCLLFDKEDRLLAVGRNECFPSGERCKSMVIGQTRSDYVNYCNSVHAEENALKNLSPIGNAPYRALLFGHTFYCDDCRIKLQNVGVVQFGISTGNAEDAIRDIEHEESIRNNPEDKKARMRKLHNLDEKAWKEMNDNWKQRERQVWDEAAARGLLRDEEEVLTTALNHAMNEFTKRTGLAITSLKTVRSHFIDGNVVYQGQVYDLQIALPDKQVNSGT